MKYLLLFVPMFCIAGVYNTTVDKHEILTLQDKITEPFIITDNAQQFVEDEIIVRFKEGVTDQAIAQIIEVNGFSVHRTNEVLRFTVLKIPERATVPDVVEYMNSLSSVDYAEPNYIYYAQVWHWMKQVSEFLDVPPDWIWSIYCAEHWLPNYTFLTKAWRLTKGKNSVILSIIDTGVAYETTAIPAGERQGIVIGTNYEKAQDLNNIPFVVPAGADIVFGDDHPNDGMTHGTHCASIVAQSANMYAYCRHHGSLAGGCVGAAPQLSIMPIRVLGPDGSGSLDDIAAGIQLAATSGADVLSLSLGGSSGSTTLENACQYAWNQGCVVFAASGNGGTSSVLYPAAYSSVIAIGSVDFGNNLTSYSQYGPEQELVAPGGENEDLNNDGIPDVIWRCAFKYEVDTWGMITATYPESLGIWGMTGTSMACPAAAACGAMMKSIAPNLTNQQVRTLLQQTATDLGSSGWDQQFGYGLVNYWAACSAAAAASTTPLAVIDSVLTIGRFADYVWNTDDTVNMNVWIRNCGNGGSAISAQIQTSSPFVTLLDNSSNYGTVAHWNTAQGDVYRFAVSGDDTIRGKPIFFQIRFNSGGWSDTDTVIVYVGKPQIMLVQDDYHSAPVNIDGSASYVMRNHYQAYEDDIDQYCFTTYPDSGYHYSVWDVWKQGTPTYNRGLCRNDHLADYDAVVWHCGVDHLSCLSTGVPDTSTLMNFMDNSGDVFLSGMDILYSQYYYPSGQQDPYIFPGNAFANSHLRLSQVDHDDYAGSADTAIGTYAGPPQTDDLLFHVAYQGYPAGADSGWPDVADDALSNNAGFAMFDNRNSNVSVKGYEGAFKLAFFAQTYENYMGNRAELMKRILDWFDLESNVIGVEESVFSTVTAPFSLQVQSPVLKDLIRCTVWCEEQSDVTFKLYDISGSLVLKKGPYRLTAGQHSIVLSPLTDRGALSSGVYFVSLESFDTVLTRKLVIY